MGWNGHHQKARRIIKSAPAVAMPITTAQLAASFGWVGALGTIIVTVVIAWLGFILFTERAEEAQRLGLANRVFGSAVELAAGVRHIAESIAAKSPLAIRGSKEILNYSRDHSLADGLIYVATWNSTALLSVDVAESMQAQRKNSLPRFDD